MTLRGLLFVFLCKFRSYNNCDPREWLYVFFTCFSLFFNGLGFTCCMVLLCLVEGVSSPSFGRW